MARLTDDLDIAAAELRDAQFEADAWERRCRAWTQTFGLGVWRERHPADRQKLRQRRNCHRVD